MFQQTKIHQNDTETSTPGRARDGKDECILLFHFIQLCFYCFVFHLILSLTTARWGISYKTTQTSGKLEPSLENKFKGSKTITHKISIKIVHPLTQVFLQRCSGLKHLVLRNAACNPQPEGVTIVFKTPKFRSKFVASPHPRCYIGSFSHPQPTKRLLKTLDNIKGKHSFN